MTPEERPPAWSIVIQAGGQSSRMGQDKALMPFLGRPLIVRLVKRLAPLEAAVWVIANRPDAYAFLGLPVRPDRVSGVGPLGGLLTALEVTATPVVAVVACDMPFLNPALLAAQRNLLEKEGVDAVVPRSPDGLEPLHAVYRREPCLAAVRAALETGQRRMIAWFGAVQVREMSPAEVAAWDPDFLSFTNVNSPEEFREAEMKARL